MVKMAIILIYKLLQLKDTIRLHQIANWFHFLVAKLFYNSRFLSVGQSVTLWNNFFCEDSYDICASNIYIVLFVCLSVMLRKM